MSMSGLLPLLRSTSLATAGLALAACALTGASATPAPATAMEQAPAPKAKGKPNILFIMIDDLRPDLGIYGHPTAQTPNMDALGKSGIVFENAFVSQAVCGPSRAALMTGLRPDTTGIQDLQTPVDKAVPDAVTLTDMFKRAGYGTYGYGKIYHHTDDNADGWTVRKPDMEKVLQRQKRKDGEEKVAVGRVASGDDLPDTINVNLALEQLPKLAKSGEPFFMAVGIHRPHLPFVSPKKDWDRYTAAKVPPPINPEGQKGAPPWALVAYEVWNYPDTKPFQPDMPKDKADELRWGYLAAVSYADDLVGNLMAELKRSGLDDNTIVVLWGDHGWKLGDHAKWSKHSTANIDIHIPLIIRAPGETRAGSRTKALVETVDIYPTIAELAGLSAPANLEGLSMVPVLEQPARAWKQAAFAQYGRAGGLTEGNGALTGYTVRTDRYRYTGWVTAAGKLVRAELYDLQKDPAESVNRINEAGYKSAATELEAIRKGGWKPVRERVGR
ncbi:sulfatase [Sphingopyxis sp.]|uniref:sulfatase n=1 Tax=Sphingopyxis sp. TaxID=1908224 RepID=UPI002DFE2711|nr:sulfatase [Sphingopyxis sp.]